MMTSKLKDEYLKAKLRSSEGTILIYRTPWVRILLDLDQQNIDTCSIEVELSLPESTIETDTSDIIDQLSNHLTYLKKLREFGFELSVIGSGCIYCASKVLDETPEDNLFSALLPP
ncbi:MAG: hypothetical protein ACFFCX_16660 [Candidatus Sifarchaeia archaeon]